MFGASASNMDRSLGSDFFVFFLTFFFSPPSDDGIVGRERRELRTIHNYSTIC